MRKTLASLLVVLAVAGGLVLSRVDDGVTLAELQDAGFAQCPPTDLACEVRVSDEWLATLESRGVDGGKRYRRTVMDARDCRALDAGIVVTDRRFYRDGGWVNGFEVIDGRCRIVADAGVPDDGGTGIKELPLECGCRRASGVCRYQLPDGGQANVPFGRTVGPGYPLRVGPRVSHSTEVFAGAGCARKACIELAGESSWPEECPGGG